MTFSREMKSTFPEIKRVSRDAVKKLECFKIDKEIIKAIRLSLDEALVNAVKHGNRMDDEKKVFLKLTADHRKVTVEIKNEGEGFNADHIPDPTGSNIKKNHGRGVFLMRKFMDKVEFFDRGRGVLMEKSLLPFSPGKNKTSSVTKEVK